MINNQESIFTQVKASLLDPYNVSIQDLDLMMNEMLSKGCLLYTSDAADE